MAGCGSDGGRLYGSGPWERHTVDDSLRGADGVKVADANGDGWPDLAVAWEGSGVARVYLHPGPDSVREQWPGVTAGVTPGAEDATWADVDDDGVLDVVTSTEDRSRRILVSFAPHDPAELLNESAWETESIPVTHGRDWMYAMPMNVDGRGGVDLIVGGKNAGAMVGWLQSPENPRDLDAWTLHEISPAGWVMSIEQFDVDSDGRIDLLVSDRGHPATRGVRWLQQPADAVRLSAPWTGHLIGAAADGPTFVAGIPGMDEVSLSAVVVPSGSASLTRFDREDPEGLLWSLRTVPYPMNVGSPKAVADGDIDLDGRSDVVLACSDLQGDEEGIVWISDAAAGDVEGAVVHSLSGAQGDKFDRVELIDLDGDGDLDVVTTEEVQGLGVIWYENPLLTAEGNDPPLRIPRAPGTLRRPSRPAPDTR